MEHRRIGDSDLTVSTVALGSWLTYAGGISREQTEACTRAAMDAGVTLFDTANVYGRGAAETAWGEILDDYPRESYVLATKVYFPMGLRDRGLSRAQILKQIDGSLARLRTDYVDLYQCHRYDDKTPLEETMGALTEVVEAGKARYIGFSEWPAARIEEALSLPGSHGRVERAHRLLERRLGVEAVRVEDVDVLEPHAAEALVEAREQVLARPPLPVRPRPHVVARFRRDDELVAVRTEIVTQELAERLLGRTVRRAVVVREIEVRDPQVERAADDRAAPLERVDAAEVVPEPERDEGQVEPAPAAAPVAHRSVAVGGGHVGHRDPPGLRLPGPSNHDARPTAVRRRRGRQLQISRIG
jgi:hypothetical protein